MDWRRVAGLTVLIVAIAIPAVLLGLPLAVRGFVRAIILLMDACLWVAISISTGVSVWSLVATVGRTIVGAFGTPIASVVLVALAAVTMVAVFVLQRLLGSEGESSG